MKIIVGLGNPGAKYVLTRHNVGFLIVDKLAAAFQIKWTKEKFSSVLGEGFINDEKVILVKPMTFMNLTGKSVAQLAGFFKASEKDLIVIHDDLDLPLGKVRLRLNGGSGGHNGIKSILACVGHENFARIKVGIGRPDSPDFVTDWVLSPFSNDELNEIQGSVYDQAHLRLMELFQTA